MRRVVTIRVLYGRRMVEDDGYPGLRFAYPGLYASPVGSASHASHVIATYIFRAYSICPYGMRQPHLIMWLKGDEVILTAERLQLQ